MLRERLSPPEADIASNEVNYEKTLILLDTDAIVSIHNTDNFYHCRRRRFNVVAARHEE